MEKICDHDKREIESLKQWYHFIRGDKMPIEYLNKLNENYAQILVTASIHSSFMEIERKK